MSTVRNDGILPISFLADANLTGYQYYVAQAASTDGYVAVADGASDGLPIGVIQDANASNVGETVLVKLFGVTKAKVAACGLADEACPIGMGDLLTTNASGYLCRAGSEAVYNAMALESITTSCRLATIEVMFFGGMSVCGLSAS